MSVTFTFATFTETPDGTVLVMGPGPGHEHRAPATCCWEADVYFGCCDHSIAERDACGCVRFDVNLANANAMTVLERMGFDADPHGLVGSADPDDILGRCLIGNIGRDDSGVDVTTTHLPGGAHMIDCGIRPGYYDDTLGRIADLATEAKARGVMVAWA